MQQSASREPSELAPSGQIDQVKVVGGKLRRKSWGRFPIFAAAFSAALALSACAAPSEYMGISLEPGAAAIELQDLARQAQAGDKQAQFELGIRYEEGRGVPVDLRRAENLYREAGADSGGPIWVYSPPVGNGTKGRMIPIEHRPKQSGLIAAQDRLLVLIAKRHTK